MMQVKQKAFPSSQRRGGCAERSEGADGVVRPAKTSAELTTPARQLLLSCRATPLKELGVTHWPARVSNPFAEREFVACADDVFGYELQALQKQFHHKAAEL